MDYYNFSAGPAQLPKSVLEQVQKDFVIYPGYHSSLIEMSHRAEPFLGIAEKLQSNIRNILQIPSNFHILLLHGGGRSQFSAIPLNLLGNHHRAGYFKTGNWSEYAKADAERFGDIELIVDTSSDKYISLPKQDDWQLSGEFDYLYYCDNETINGVEFNYVPNSQGIPLVCDMSSNIFSRPIDFEKYGLIFACAQKNFGPPGVTLVLVRDDLLDQQLDCIPRIMEYKLQVSKKSMFNTVDVFAWYVSNLVMEWLEENGGVAVMQENANQRSNSLYDYIDQSTLYTNNVSAVSRSRMNVVFDLKQSELNDKFLAESITHGLSGLKGHRFRGGFRASLYNSMPVTGVEKLIRFMDDFSKKYS